MSASNVKVVVRARPLNKPHEKQCILHMTPSATSILLPSRRAPLTSSSDNAGSTTSLKTFNFDQCFWSLPAGSFDAAEAPSLNSLKQPAVLGPVADFATQEDVFRAVGLDVLENSWEGYNSCVFSYGQTGSGKSYSMMGSQSDPGIIPRLCSSLFDKIHAAADFDPRFTTFRVEISYMEIYNERVRDLLLTDNRTFRVREHPTGGPYVEDLSKFEVKSYQDILKYIDTGNKQRTVAGTAMNDQSSRSHAIFSIELTRIKYEPDLDISHQRTSKIKLVDLAGSERAATSQTRGDRLKEGANINKSLSTLGLVIKALVERGRGGDRAKTFVPYRDSVLTWLLKECLGGNSKTVMLATVSPSELHGDETLSTLRYAYSAKNIVNDAVVNEDPNATIIKELLEEVARLKAELANAAKPDANVSQYQDEIDRLKKLVHEKDADMRNLQTEWEARMLESKPIQFSLPNRSGSFLAQSSTAEPIMYSAEILSEMNRNSEPYDIADKPHLVNINEDASKSDSIIHYLESGKTLVGSSARAQITIDSDFIEPFHCVIELKANGNVYISPADPNDTYNAPSSVDDDDLVSSLPLYLRDSFRNNDILSAPSGVYINGQKIDRKVKLRHGNRILLGRSHLFRFYHPLQAISSRRNLDEYGREDGSRTSSCVSSISDGFGSSSDVDSIVPCNDASMTFVQESPTNMNSYMDEEAAMAAMTNAKSPVTTSLATLPMNEAGLVFSDVKKKHDRATPSSNDFEVSEQAALNSSPQEERIHIGTPHRNGPTATIQIDIPYFELVESTDDTHYVYHIDITLKSEKLETWHVARRFSEFWSFHKQWRSRLPKLIAASFPKASVASVIIDWASSVAFRNSAERRRKGLESYMNGVLNWWLNEWVEEHVEIDAVFVENQIPFLNCTEAKGAYAGVWIPGLAEEPATMDYRHDENSMPDLYTSVNS